MPEEFSVKSKSFLEHHFIPLMSEIHADIDPFATPMDGLIYECIIYILYIYIYRRIHGWRPRILVILYSFFRWVDWSVVLLSTRWPYLRRSGVSLDHGGEGRTPVVPSGSDSISVEERWNLTAESLDPWQFSDQRFLNQDVSWLQWRP